jgi:hypothetical protein
MTARERALAVICVLLHAWVVWNVYEWSSLTPRIVSVTFCGDL